MDILLGLTGRDFTIIAASKAAMRGVTILKATDDKTRQLSETTVMAYAGEAGDTVQFAEYIQANIRLYGARNGATLQPAAIAAYTRNELARALRSRHPYNVNLLLGGVVTTPAPAPSSNNPAEDAASTAPQAAEAPRSDTATRQAPARPDAAPKLYWLDYLATLAEVPYAAHGYAQYYCLSILDKHHHPDIDREQGLKVLRMCADELKRRMPIDFKGLMVRVCTKDGVELVEWDEGGNIMPA